MSSKDYGKLSSIGVTVKPTSAFYIGVTPSTTTRSSIDTSDVKVLYITSAEEYNECVQSEVHDQHLREIVYVHGEASARIQFLLLRSAYDNATINAFLEVLHKCVMIGMQVDNLPLEYHLAGNDKHYYLTLTSGWANRPNATILEREIAYRWHHPFLVMPRVIVPNTGDVKGIWASDWVKASLYDRGGCECMYAGDMSLLKSVGPNEVHMNQAIHHHLYEKRAKSEPMLANYVNDKYAFILSGFDRATFDNAAIASKIVLAIAEDHKCTLAVACNTYQRTLVNIGASMSDELPRELVNKVYSYKISEGNPYNIHTLLYLMRHHCPRMYLWYLRVRIDQLANKLGRSKSDDILAMKSLIFHSKYIYYGEKRSIYRITPYGAPQKVAAERGNITICGEDRDFLDLDEQIRYIWGETNKTSRNNHAPEMIPMPSGDTRDYTCIQDGVIEDGVYRLYLCGDHVERTMGFHLNTPRDEAAIERCKKYYRYLFGDVVGEFMLYLVCTRILGTPCKRLLHLKGATGAGKTFLIQRWGELFGTYQVPGSPKALIGVDSDKASHDDSFVSAFKGARLSTFDEFGAGIDSTRVKSITSGQNSQVTARVAKGNDQTYRVNTLPVFSTNGELRFSEYDDAIHDRLIYINLSRRFDPNKGKDLSFDVNSHYQAARDMYDTHVRTYGPSITSLPKELVKAKYIFKGKLWHYAVAGALVADPSAGIFLGELMLALQAKRRSGLPVISQQMSLPDFVAGFAPHIKGKYTNIDGSPVLLGYTIRPEYISVLGVALTSVSNDLTEYKPIVDGSEVEAFLIDGS